MKLNCQYFYLDKLQNSISFPLLSPPHPHLLPFYICVHYLKGRYGLKDVVVGKKQEIGKQKLIDFHCFLNMKEYVLVGMYLHMK